MTGRPFRHRLASLRLFVACNLARFADPRAWQQGELLVKLAQPAGCLLACVGAGGDLAARRGRKCGHR